MDGQCGGTWTRGRKTVHFLVKRSKGFRNDSAHSFTTYLKAQSVRPRDRHRRLEGRAGLETEEECLEVPRSPFDLLRPARRCGEKYPTERGDRS
jgi:hypothetical protein